MPGKNGLARILLVCKRQVNVSCGSSETCFCEVSNKPWPYLTDEKSLKNTKKKSRYPYSMHVTNLGLAINT